VETAFHDAYGSESKRSNGGSGRRVSCRSASVLRRQYILFSRGILSAVFLRFAQELLRTPARKCPGRRARQVANVEGRQVARVYRVVR